MNYRAPREGYHVLRQSPLPNRLCGEVRANIPSSVTPSRIHSAIEHIFRYVVHAQNVAAFHT